MMLITDIHASPPPFEFDFLLSPNTNPNLNPKDEMSHTGDQGSIKIEEVREREKEQEDGGGEDVTMTTGMSLSFCYLLLCVPVPSRSIRDLWHISSAGR
jgi:hypothetical protein